MELTTQTGPGANQCVLLEAASAGLQVECGSAVTKGTQLRPQPGISVAPSTPGLRTDLVWLMRLVWSSGGQHHAVTTVGELAADLAADSAIASGHQRYGAHLVDCLHIM